MATCVNSCHANADISGCIPVNQYSPRFQRYSTGLSDGALCLAYSHSFIPDGRTDGKRRRIRLRSPDVHHNNFNSYSIFIRLSPSVLRIYSAVIILQLIEPVGYGSLDVMFLSCQNEFLLCRMLKSRTITVQN